MVHLLYGTLALAGFGFAFALTWFLSFNLLLSLLVGLLGAGCIHRWSRRLHARGPAKEALSHLALRQLYRRGGVTAAELANLSGVGEEIAREVLDGLVRRGLARKDRERYRL